MKTVKQKLDITKVVLCALAGLFFFGAALFPETPSKNAEIFVFLGWLMFLLAGVYAELSKRPW